MDGFMSAFFRLPKKEIVEEEDDDSFLSDLEEEEEEEEESVVNVRNMQKIHEFPEIHKEHWRQGEKICTTHFPQGPPVVSINNTVDYIDRLFYNLYYAVQYVIAYDKYNTEIPAPDPWEKNEEKALEKWYFVHLYERYREFASTVKEVATRMRESFSIKLAATLRERGVVELNDHPLWWFFHVLHLHKELHSRGFKVNPGTARIKSDHIQDTVNSVTSEIYDPKNDTHRNWRQLFILPLPSDYDEHEIDPKEGTLENALMIAVRDYNNESKIPPPFSIVVTQEWDRLFRLLHNLHHFEEYFHHYIVQGITDSMRTQTKNMTWAESWKVYMGEFSELEPVVKRMKVCPVAWTVNRLKGSKKKIPTTVFRMIEFRNILETAVRVKFN